MTRRHCREERVNRRRLQCPKRQEGAHGQTAGVEVVEAGAGEIVEASKRFSHSLPNACDGPRNSGNHVPHRRTLLSFLREGLRRSNPPNLGNHFKRYISFIKKKGTAEKMSNGTRDNGNRKSFTQSQLNRFMKERGLYDEWQSLGMTNAAAVWLLRGKPESGLLEDRHHVRSVLASFVNGCMTRTARRIERLKERLNNAAR